MLHVKNKRLHASIQPPKHPQLRVRLHLSVRFQFQLSGLNILFFTWIIFSLHKEDHTQQA